MTPAVVVLIGILLLWLAWSGRAAPIARAIVGAKP